MKKWLETDSFEEAFEKFNDNMGEIEQKLTEPLILENLIENGDFSDGVVGWTGYRNTLTVDDGVLKVVKLNADTNATVYQTVNILTGSKVYVGLDVKRDSVGRLGTTWQVDFNQYTNVNEWQLLSVVAVAKSKTLHIATNKSSAVIGDTTYLRNIILIDLTQVFGAGNEPTKEQMDEIINITGWFDNEYAVSNKEMFIALLNMIRKNTMAITALGGTQ